MGRHDIIFSPAYFPPKVGQAHTGLPNRPPLYLRLDSKLQALKGKVLKNSAAVKMLTYLTLTNSQSSQSGVEVVELAATWSARSLSSVMSLKPVCLGDVAEAESFLHLAFFQITYVSYVAS